MVSAYEREFIWNSFRRYLGTGVETDFGGYFDNIGKERIISLIRRYELQFVFSVLKDECAALFGNSAAEEIETYCREVVFFNSVLDEMAANLFGALYGKGLDFILFKGISTLRRLYTGEFPRKISDIDILVRPDDYGSASEILNSEGYFINRKYYERFRRSRNIGEMVDEIPEISFVRSVGKIEIAVDMHMSLDCSKRGSFRNKLYGLNLNPFSEYEFMELKNGIRVKVPNLEFDFLNSVMHVSLHHALTGFKWLSDICLYVMKFGGEFDWDKIFIWAGTESNVRIITYALYTVGEILCGNGPELLRMTGRFDKSPGYLTGKYLMKSFFTDRMSLAGKINSRIQQAFVFPCGLKNKIASALDLFRYF